MKILVSDKMADEAIQLLKDAGHEVTYDEVNHETLSKEISNYDGLMVRSRTKATTEIVEAGGKENLKVIGRAGIGVDNIDIETAAKQGIKVVNSPSGASVSVAELAISHMLSLSRKLTIADSTMKKGEWAKKQLKGTEMNGKTLGLIGSGGIAKETARLGKCFNMNVLVYSPHCTDEKAKGMDATRKDLDELLEQSDFVSLHIPHTQNSHYLINEEKLSLMKNTAYLIDCSRGGVVEADALYNGLKNNIIAGAAIDVFEKEPPEDNKLASLDNVVLSPHIGANTKEGQIRAGTVCAEQMIMVLKDEEPEFWVNKKYFT